MVYESPFISSEPVLFEMVGTAISKEYDSNETLHFCEDERSSSPLSMFEPLPSGPEYIILDHDWDINMTLHDASLEMENQWAMEFYEAPTLEYKEKDSSLKYHKNHARLMPLQSQSRFVPWAYTRNTTALRSSHAKPLEGQL